SDDVTHYPITQPPAAQMLYVPIGQPLANTRLYILDCSLQPVPVGVAGELCVGGIGVGRGYRNDAKRTAAGFVPDPFAPEPGARLYRTGDVARYRADGTLELLGRLDHQVKIRGFRIELGEIEGMLSQLSTVSEAVVQAHADVSGEKCLVAYIVPAHELPPTIRELRSFLARRLPDYMIPATFVMREALPLTSNGKVDRQALLPPARVRPELE